MPTGGKLSNVSARRADQFCRRDRPLAHHVRPSAQGTERASSAIHCDLAEMLEQDKVLLAVAADTLCNGFTLSQPSVALNECSQLGSRAVEFSWTSSSRGSTFADRADKRQEQEANNAAGGGGGEGEAAEAGSARRFFIGC